MRVMFSKFVFNIFSPILFFRYMSPLYAFLILCLMYAIIQFQGLNKDKEKVDRKSSEAKVTNSFWVYSITNDKWTCFYKNENNSSIYWNKMQSEEPRPRYAHQLVYDESNRVRLKLKLISRKKSDNIGGNGNVFFKISAYHWWIGCLKSGYQIYPLNCR